MFYHNITFLYRCRWIWRSYESSACWVLLVLLPSMKVGWRCFLRWHIAGSLGLRVWLRAIRCIGYREAVLRILWYVYGSWVRLVWPILVLVLIISERLDALGWVYHLVTFFLIDLNLFEIGISSQDVCHILVVCIFIHLFTSWYGRVVMVEDKVKVIASFASVSTFTFPGMPVCEGTHMNSIALWVDVIMLWIW